MEIPGNSKRASKCCFFCYKKYDLEGPGGGSKTTKNDTEMQGRFLRFVGRYYNPSKTTGEEDGNDLGGTEAFFCCRQCFELVEAFCEVYHRMKVVQLEVTWRLWQLMSVMKNADVVSGTGGGGRGSCGVESAEVAVKLRADLLQKCSWKLDHTSPRLSMSRCDGSHGNISPQSKFRFFDKPQRRARKRTAHRPSPRDNLNPRDMSITSKAIITSSPRLQKKLKVTFKDSTPVKNYKCLHCPKSFNTIQNLKDHALKDHKDKLLGAYKLDSMSDTEFAGVIADIFKLFSVKHKCMLCNRQYGRKDVVERHIMLRHSQRLSAELKAYQIQAPTSKGMTPPITVAYFPKKIKRGPGRPRKSGASPSASKFRCHICSKILSSLKSYQVHLRIHSSSKKYKCSYCDLEFRQPANVNSHVFKFHRVRIFANAKLDATSSDEFETLINQVLAKFVDKKLCALCSRRHLRRDDCERHVMLSHSENVCEELRSRQGLSTDQVLHSSPKTQFSCEICSKQHSTRFALQRHVAKAHSDGGGNQCTHCGMKFSSNSSLDLHMVGLHPEKILRPHQVSGVSDSEFLGVIRNLFKSFVVNAQCVVCGLTSERAVSCEKHIMYHHSEWLRNQLRSAQQGLHLTKGGAQRVTNQEWQKF